MSFDTSLGYLNRASINVLQYSCVEKNIGVMEME